MNPILFSLGNIHIYTYGFLIMISLIMGTGIAYLELRRQGIPFYIGLNTATWGILFMFLGAKLLYLLFHLSTQKFRFDLAASTSGGNVFYGGLLASLFGAYFYLKRTRQKIGIILDAGSIAVALGLSIGRIGCFIAGCCYGIFLEKNSIFYSIAIYFPEESLVAPSHVPLFPIQLLMSLNSFVITVFLWKWRTRVQEGQLFWTFLLYYSFTRFGMEFLRGDDRGIFFFGLFSGSQVISLFLFFIAGRAIWKTKSFN